MTVGVYPGSFDPFTVGHLDVLSSAAGLFGMTAAFMLLLIRLAGLESFGQNYLAPFAGVRGADALLRPRLRRMGGQKQ